MSEVYHLRLATPADEAIIQEMLFYAAHMNDEPGKTIAHVPDDPGLARYVQGWGRAGDLGVIAERESDGRALGAVWVRLFRGEDKAYSPVDDETPELAIAVLPESIGRGLGTALMQRLISEARGKYPAIALNVRAENPALRLYQRLGFEQVGEFTNRAGTRSVDMRLRLKPT